ncbi:VRR-NUC domain-containing protein [Cercophora newfieldiana]|uniref:Fanconi-associated nuclease n=1 Tax=Cercophora newfieldiana TaxID=92897 RepID=A0AA40D1J4_9PEZI|nr:VRR-NUC domain-containing protein [Cercophora newfieldiana]
MDRFVQRSKPPASRAPLARGSVNTRIKSEGPPMKKARIREVKDSDNDDEDSSCSGYDGADSEFSIESHSRAPKTEPSVGFDPENHEDLTSAPQQGQTAFERSLPSVSTDKEAIEEYEAMRASQASHVSEPAEQQIPGDTVSRLESRQWVRGKSSIYVDAFNLALDTVLEDEAHLFDDKEKSVFDQWRGLGYEAQYLYVRLFLRKTASWHRIQRLGYHNDISNVDDATTALLEPRVFPESQKNESEEQETVGALQEWSLGQSFTFVDDSESHIKTMEEAASLLSLDELKALAKDAKFQGRNKADLVKSFCRMSSRQFGLLSFGLRRSSTNDSGSDGSGLRDESPDKQDSNRNTHFLAKILTITGPLIRLSDSVFKLFERVHLVFYRSTEWTEKSLTTIILAKISRRNFPEYIVCRSINIFPSRRRLLEFEDSMRQEYEVDKVLEFNGPPGEAGFHKVFELFEAVAPRWRQLLKEEQRREDEVYEFGEGAYLRRFNAAHAYTRIAHKAAHVLGRLHRYREEYDLLTEMLSQRLFHPGRRGSWYQRKALLEERYMWELDPSPVSVDPEVQKKHWYRIAVTTCEAALEDRDCHLIYHHDLQKRLLKLEKRLRIPRRLQHDFGHVKLRQPEEHSIQGIQLVRDEPDATGKAGRGPSTKTIWLDELGEPGEDGKPLHVSVEEMCLSHYRSQGWKGYHSEGGILRTLFAYLFFDILFIYIPNVFQTAFQTCPLDLHTDAFYPARASEINHRLVEIANGEAGRLLREVDKRERERRTCAVGLNWDFEYEDLNELVGCFDGGALAAICKVMAQDYRSRGSGVPDLVLWRTEPPGSGGGRVQGEVMFSEVKSANDRLSDTQRLWIDVLTGAGVRVALCNAVAKETRTIG